jgi:hypothetical protein
LHQPVWENVTAPPLAANGPEAGRFLTAFSYSGPTAAVRVRTGAQDGARIYADRDFVFQALPARLQGSDWVQTANADTLYSAVDLLNFSLTGDAVVFVAHDARLPAPDWLQEQFHPTDMTMTVNGQPMRILARRAHGGESLTLGSNTENRALQSCNMYVVFVQRDDGSLNAVN